MSARDEALDLLEKILPREHAKAYRELFSKRFDAYAHELAEEIRQDAYLIEDEDDCCRKYGLALARTIDPSSAGPVRPDEEPTT